jgi:hypothetical protein
LIGRPRPRSAGALLLLSVVTPTYFFAVLNLPALIVGVALLAAPEKVLSDGRDVKRAASTS